MRKVAGYVWSVYSMVSEAPIAERGDWQVRSVSIEAIAMQQAAAGHCRGWWGGAVAADGAELS